MVVYHPNTTPYYHGAIILPADIIITTILYLTLTSKMSHSIMAPFSGDMIDSVIPRVPQNSRMKDLKGYNSSSRNTPHPIPQWSSRSAKTANLAMVNPWMSSCLIRTQSNLLSISSTKSLANGPASSRSDRKSSFRNNFSTTHAASRINIIDRRIHFQYQEYSRRKRGGRYRLD